MYAGDVYIPYLQEWCNHILYSNKLYQDACGRDCKDGVSYGWHIVYCVSKWVSKL